MCGLRKSKRYPAPQRQDLPQLGVIYSSKFEGKVAFYQISQYYYPGPTTDLNRPPYFACTQKLDCNYLNKFFLGEKVEVLKEYTIREDQFNIYILFVGHEARFVLLLERRNSYGKIGS